MKKVQLNSLIDLLAFICLLFLTSTGIILHYLLPPGSGKSLAIWGMSRHEWGEVHFIIALFLIAILLVHIFFHWKWILAVLKGRKSLAVLLFIILLALSVAPLLSGVEKSQDFQEDRVDHGKGMKHTTKHKR